MDLAGSVFGVTLFADHRAGPVEMRRLLVPVGSARLAVWAPPERLAHLRIRGEAVRDAFPTWVPVAQGSGQDGTGNRPG